MNRFQKLLKQHRTRVRRISWVINQVEERPRAFDQIVGDTALVIRGWFMSSRERAAKVKDRIKRSPTLNPYVQHNGTALMLTVPLCVACGKDIEDHVPPAGQCLFASTTFTEEDLPF